MRWLRFLSIFLLLPIAACALNPRPDGSLAETAGPYHLDSGDVVKVTVYGDATLSSSYKVDDSGAIAMALVGPVPARGLTTTQVAAEIASALGKGFMRNPNVAVEVDQYRPFYIQGDVKSSGQFPYSYGMTVRAAIATAGGPSGKSDPTRATVYRRVGDRVVKAVVGLDFPIQPGDTITINTTSML
ncbi:MAG TPA: polysaccharide biosynthesis/export family protein [Devosiaceae bacterium]